MTRIWTLGSDAVLPAFVVGYEYSRLAPVEVIGSIKDRPSWLLTLEHQAGGYDVNAFATVGAVLRLEANPDRATRVPTTLIEGLKAMAEDPDMKVLAGHPVLKGLVRTTGKPYPKSDLQSLEAYLSTFYKVPPIESGIEALVQHAVCDPLQFFEGWKMAGRTPDGARSKPTFLARSFDGDQIPLADDEVFTAGVLGYLRSFEHLSGYPLKQPRVYLLWQNSD